MRTIAAPHETSPQLSRWPYLIGGLLGVCIGSLITVDFLASNYLHLRIFDLYILRRLPLPTLGPGPSLHLDTKEVPYILSALVTLSAIGFGILYMNSERIWRQKFKILLALVVVSYQTRNLFTTGRLDIYDFIALAFLAVWLLHSFMNEHEGFVLSPVFFILLALYGAMLLSTVNGRFRSFGSFGVESKNLILFALLANFLRRREMLRYYTKLLVVITAISAVIAIVQEVLYLSSGIVFIGIVEKKALRLLFEDTSLGTFLRAPAFFGYPQLFANTLAVVSTMVFFLILSPDLKLFKRRILLYPIFFLLITSLILSFSRGAMLAFMVASVLALYLKKPSLSIHFTAMLASILLVGAIVAILEPAILREVADKVSAEFNYGDVKGRSELARLSLTEAMRRYPFIGVGLGLGVKYTHHFFGWPAHNAFILALSEVGLLGFLLYSMAFALIFVRLISTILVTRDDESRSLGKLLLAGFVALILDIQIDPFFQIAFLWHFWGMTEGLAGASLKGQRFLPVAPLGAISHWSAWRRGSA